MLEFYSNESRIEVLSLSQDLGRIAHRFFRDDEPRNPTQGRKFRSDCFQLNSTLEALAEECRQTSLFDVIFVCGVSDPKSTWKQWLEHPTSFERSVAELAFQLTCKASNHRLIVVSRDFEALVLIEDIRVEEMPSVGLSNHGNGELLIFLNATEFGFPTVSKSPLGQNKRKLENCGTNVFSARLSRSVWKFQRQQRSFRRIGISKEPQRDLSQISNGFDPTAWHDVSTTHLTPFIYLRCGLREMDDSLFWAIWRSIRGHRKLQLVASSVHPVCGSAALPTCPLCNHPQTYLERLLWTRSPRKRRTLLTILRWVAYSLRPLGVQELLVAVSTNTELNRGAANAETNNTEGWHGSPDDLLALCEGLLGRSSDGTIRFVHESVKKFLQSPAMRALDAWEDRQIHEMMAVVCLRHVTCVDETALLRPWTQAGKQLREPRSRCCLRDYSTLHWHQHFRLAESTSMYLPSLLYQALQAAFRKLDFESNIGEGILAVERRIDQGLLFCCRNDFVKVGKLFLEMGAKRSTEGWSTIHVAAAFGSVGLLEFLIRSYVRSDECEQLFEAHWSRDAYSPLELAAFHGKTAAVELLLEIKARVFHLPELNRTSTLVTAAEYGHQEVVESLLKHGMRPEYTEEAAQKALYLAEELEYDGIAELIRTYGSSSHSDFDPQKSPARSTSSRVILTDCNSSQNPTAHTLEVGVRNLDLSQLGLADVDVGVDVRESGELGDWSLVQYAEADTVAEAHMDMENG